MKKGAIAIVTKPITRVDEKYHLGIGRKCRIVEASKSTISDADIVSIDFEVFHPINKRPTGEIGTMINVVVENGIPLKIVDPATPPARHHTSVDIHSQNDRSSPADTLPLIDQLRNQTRFSERLLRAPVDALLASPEQG